MSDKDFKFEYPYSFKHRIDLCIVIDITATMAPYINSIRKDVFDMYRRILGKMSCREKNVDKVRIRIIGFRDFTYDGDKALVESRFFNLPEEERELRYFLATAVKAKGGGSRQKSALEALAVAMRSDWVAAEDEQTKVHHFIILYTDSPAAPLRDSPGDHGYNSPRFNNPSYPANMPKTMAELSDMWDGNSQDLPGMPDPSAKRFILFAPDAEPWNSMVWGNTWIIQSKAGEGLSEVDKDMTLDALLCNSSFL